MLNIRSIRRNAYFFSMLVCLFCLPVKSAGQENNENAEEKKSAAGVQQFGKLTDPALYVGSAAVLSGKTIEKTAFNNTKNALAGYIPGLYVSQGGGEPGAEWSTMFIRGKRTTSNGSNDPLILVDGFERDMNFMDPNEIESITVLKDAAGTAIYGLKGASGVIEVRTKRGREGKTNVTFDTQLTLKSAMNVPKALGSVDYMTYYNQAQVNDGYAPDFYASELIEKYRNNNNPYQYPDVNWLDNYFNPHSYKQRYSLSIDGGSKIAKYYVLFSYVGDKGNIVTDPSINRYSTQNKWDKYSIRTNIDVQITSKLNLEAGVSSMFSFVNNPSNTSGVGLYRLLMDYNPNVHPVLNADKSIAGTQMYTNNPYKVSNYSGYSESFNRYVTATTRLNFDLNTITRGLSIYGAFAFDNNYTHISRRIKETPVYELQIDPVTGLPRENNGAYIYRQWGLSTPLSLTGSSGTYYRKMNYELGLNYQRRIRKHDIFARVFGFNYDYQDDVRLPTARAGINGGVNYVFDNRYLVDISASWSGTEQFPPENRMYLYPALGLGWVATNELFLKDSPVLSYFKLRGSYGITGSDNITNNGSNLYYYYIISLARGGTAFFGEGNPASITAGNFSTGYLEGTIANPILRPESTEKINAGFDARFLNDRLSASFDYFNEYTKHILAVSKSMPGIMGVPNARMMLENIGEVSNKGIELQVGWSDKIGAFNYFINANATYSKNKVEYLDEEPGLAEPQTGYPLDAYWGFLSDGFFQTNEEVALWADQSSVGNTTKGDLRFINQNPEEDNIINEYDRVYLGTVGIPDWFYGITLGGSYKRWEVSVLFQGVSGMNKIFRDGINRPFSNSGNIYDFHVGNFWTEENSIHAKYPRLTIDGSSSTKAKADFWMKDASYLRLKNLEVSYTFPTKWISNTSNMRFYLSGTNLLCWDKLDGIADPDISADGRSYPVNRMFTAGFRVNL
jgi:TonB-linked SusC/RagA family outer membrane protein